MDGGLVGGTYKGDVSDEPVYQAARYYEARQDNSVQKGGMPGET
jgi:hypothetical protein